MARRPRKRRPRHKAAAAGEGPDRFSCLSDDLLRNILSRLPTTRCAAKLAAVSRQFRKDIPRLLERVDSIRLHEPHFQVDLQDTPPLLLRRLVITPHHAIPPSFFRPILHNAAQHGVSELVFRLTHRARLPKNVLSLKSLTVLVLDNCAVAPWSDVVCPVLRTLTLNRVAIRQETINRILASTSCLDTLEMLYCTGLGTGRASSCTVESSSVRNLVFRPTVKLKHTIIRALALRTVTLYMRSKGKELELAPAPDVRKAYLHVAKSPKIRESFKLRPFLDAGVRLDCLALRNSAVKVLSSEYENIPKLMVMFRELRILSVTLDFSDVQETTFLLKLLESCPNLQKLSLAAAKTYIANYLPADHKERLASISCLTTSLVQFKFLGFKPQEYQKELMVFLLTQGKNLKKVGVEFEKGQAAAVNEILSVKRFPIERTSTKYMNPYMELEYPDLVGI